MSLQLLKNLNTDKMIEVEELMVLSAFARSLETEYLETGNSIPEWLDRSANSLREEIARRTRAARMAKLRDIENQLEAMKPATEKRADLQAQAVALQKELGLVKPARSGR